MTGIHTNKSSYRITRAIRSILDGKLDGLEGEVSAEIRRNSPRRSYASEGFSVPIEPDDDLRALMFPNAHRRDLSTVTGAGGLYVLPDLPLIDLLRPKLVLGRLGATWLTEMESKFAIPRSSSASSTQWLPEGGGATPDNPTLDNVEFSPSIACDITNVSRMFINSNSVGSERYVLGQAVRNLAVALDYVAIDGQGSSSNQPLGLMSNTSIQANSASLAIGANGGPVQWGNVLALEESVALNNADVGSLGYLSTNPLRNALKQRVKISGSTVSEFIWQDGLGYGEGRVNSYRAETTNNVPSNLTKGSGSGLSALIFGNFASLVIATFRSGVELLVNPYSNQSSAAVLITAILACDCNVTHSESFRVIYDGN